MSSNRHELELLLSPRQFEQWSVAAASHGLSVQDYVRRAVSDYDPKSKTELRDLDDQIKQYMTRYDHLIEQAQRLAAILDPNGSSS